MSEMNKQSGFITLLGETNAGKSTLVNNFIKYKISIVSHKVQTTRFSILGVLTKEDKQLIFIDTPGIFYAKRNFDKHMLKISYDSINEADLVIFLLDAKKGITELTNKIVGSIPKDKEQIMVINKMDLLNKQEIVNLLSKVAQFKNFKEFFIISAKKNKNIDKLLNYLFKFTPHNNWFFDDDQISNQNIQTLATETTREKIYQYIHQEIPYNIQVNHISWDENDTSVVINQEVLVGKKSYKGIILGKNGETIKQIRVSSQQDITKYLNKNVSLYLTVKVDSQWLNR